MMISSPCHMVIIRIPFKHNLYSDDIWLASDDPSRRLEQNCRDWDCQANFPRSIILPAFFSIMDMLVTYQISVDRCSRNWADVIPDMGVILRNEIIILLSQNYPNVEFNGRSSSNPHSGKLGDPWWLIVDWMPSYVSETNAGGITRHRLNGGLAGYV